MESIENNNRQRRKHKMKKLLYVCFGDALSWNDLSRKFPDLIKYLNTSYKLDFLDYSSNCIDFEELLILKEKEADIIIYDQTTSSYGSSQDLPYLYGYRPKEQKIYLTLTGNLKPEEFIKDLEDCCK